MLQCEHHFGSFLQERDKNMLVTNNLFSLPPFSDIETNHLALFFHILFVIHDIFTRGVHHEVSVTLLRRWEKHNNCSLSLCAWQTYAVKRVFNKHAILAASVSTAVCLWQKHKQIYVHEMQPKYHKVHKSAACLNPVSVCFVWTVGTHARSEVLRRNIRQRQTKLWSKWCKNNLDRKWNMN